MPSAKPKTDHQHAMELAKLRRDVAVAIPPPGFPYCVAQVLLRYKVSNKLLEKWTADPTFLKEAYTHHGPHKLRYFDPEAFDMWLFHRPRHPMSSGERWREFVDGVVAQRLAREAKATPSRGTTAEAH